MPTPKIEEDIGTCGVIVDDSRRGDEEVCGDEADTEILVRNDFGLFAIPICKIHKEAHRQYYQDRARKVRPRRHS